MRELWPVQLIHSLYYFLYTVADPGCHKGGCFLHSDPLLDGTWPY